MTNYDDLLAKLDSAIRADELLASNRNGLLVTTRDAIRSLVAENAALTAQRDALREALERIKAGWRYIDDGEAYRVLLDAATCRDIAVAALRAEQDKGE